MDFGLAKMGGDVHLTKAGMTLGTAAYMSPEQARGEVVDQRTDIWAFGVVLYEMLTGQLPFRGVYEQAMIYSILNEEPQPVGDLRAGVPTQLQQIAEKTLRKNATERYQNCGEILADLKAIVSGESSAVTQTHAVDSGAGTIRRSRLLYGGMAILLVLATITWFATRKPATPTAADGNSIAVMYFENRSSEQDLDKILVDMLTTNLARHDGLDVVSSQRLFDILKNMGKQDIGNIDKTVATEVANKARVKTMLLGSIIQIGNRLRITSQLTNVETGDIIASEQAEGEKIEDIFGMVDELTEKISGKLIIAGRGPAEQPLRIADATTADYRAYQFYQRGLEYEWRWDYNTAAKNFERAVEIDSTFAMAHLKIAYTRYIFDPTNHYADLAPARKRIALAERHSIKTNPKEQLYIAALKAAFDRRMDQSISLFSGFVKQYPDEKEGWFLLGIFYYWDVNLEQGLAAM
jgi:TolB-like protein